MKSYLKGEHKMKHNNKKVEVIEMENVNNMNEEVEETGEIIEEEVKEKMSLKIGRASCRERV